MTGVRVQNLTEVIDISKTVPHAVFATVVNAVSNAATVYYKLICIIGGLVSQSFLLIPCSWVSMIHSLIYIHLVSPNKHLFLLSPQSS